MREDQGAGRAAVGFGFFVAVVIGIALLAKGLYPADLPFNRSPDFVDNIFDNRGVLWAARLLLVSAAGVLAFGGIFIVLSIGMRMKNGEWLRRAGPFEISDEPLGRIEEEADLWHQAALAHREEAAGLRERLERSEELIEDLQSLA
jgi:hypothetical protein